jgi:hypothetical protein
LKVVHRVGLDISTVAEELIVPGNAREVHLAGEPVVGEAVSIESAIAIESSVSIESAIAIESSVSIKPAVAVEAARVSSGSGAALTTGPESTISSGPGAAFSTGPKASFSPRPEAALATGSGATADAAHPSRWGPEATTATHSSRGGAESAAATANPMGKETGGSQGDGHACKPKTNPVHN